MSSVKDWMWSQSRCFMFRKPNKYLCWFQRKEFKIIQYENILLWFDGQSYADFFFPLNYSTNMQGKLHPGIALNNAYFVHTSQSFLSSRVICFGDNYSLAQAHLVLWGRCTKFPHQLLQPNLGILRESFKHENALDFLADTGDRSSTRVDPKFLWRKMAGTQSNFEAGKNLRTHLLCLSYFHSKDGRN